VAAILIIPLLAAAALIGLSYLKYDARSSGVWFQSQKGRRMGIFAALTALVITPLGVIADEYFIDFAAWLPGVPSIISTGLLPLIIVAASVTGFYQLVRKRYAASNNEAIQAVFIFLLVSFIILTIIGVWFRGTGMVLKWPWGYIKSFSGVQGAVFQKSPLVAEGIKQKGDYDEDMQRKRKKHSAPAVAPVFFIQGAVGIGCDWGCRI
jgi:hypothetical protein